MKPVQVRNIKIGADIPKICVPIVASTREAIIKEAESFHSIPVDIVEWRADWYEDVEIGEQVLETLRQLRNALGEIPLLFTFRTAKEGGEKELDEDTYRILNELAARSGYVDLIDVEIFTGDAVVSKIISAAHEADVRVVASNHDFHKTPPMTELISRLAKMERAGADILKVAVMPTCKKDVLELLAATEEASSVMECPVITMSMAGMGAVSRICGEVFGSALTFGAAAKASAPGQIGVQELHDMLQLLHKSL